MPLIPDYRSTVQLSPQPRVRQRLDSRGAFGPNVEQFAQDVQRAKLMFDEYKAKSAYTQYSTEMANLVENPETGLINLKGEAVFGVNDMFNEKESEIRQKYLVGMSGRAASRANTFMDNARAGYQSTVFRHQRRETEALFDSTDAAAQKISEGKAIQHVGTELEGVAIAEIRANIDSFARRKGFSPGSPIYNGLVQESIGRVSAGIVQKYIDSDNPEAAKEYLNRDEVKNNMNGEQHAKLMGTVDRIGSITKAQAQVGALAGQSYGQKVEWGRKNLSGPAEKEFMSQLEYQEAQNKRAETEWRGNLYEAGTENVRKFLEANDLPGAKKYIESIPDQETRNDLYTLLSRSGTQLGRADQYFQNEETMNIIRRGIDQGFLVLKDVDGVEKTWPMETPAQANMVARHLGLSDVSHWKSIDDYIAQGGAVGEINQTKVNDALRSLVTEKGRVNTPKQIDKNYPGIYNFVVENWPKGELYSREKLRKIVAQGIASGEVIGGGIRGYIDPDMSYRRAVQEGKEKEWLPDVSDEETDRIIRILQAREIKVTEQKIREYKKHIILGIPRN